MQLILLKYDSIKAQTKPTMLRYFWKSLKPSILARFYNKNLELKSFMWIIKKTIVTKAKANLWLQATTCNIDQNCP